MISFLLGVLATILVVVFMHYENKKYFILKIDDDTPMAIQIHGKTKFVRVVSEDKYLSLFLKSLRSYKD